MGKLKLHMDTHVYLTDMQGLTQLEDLRFFHTYEADSKSFEMLKTCLLHDIDLVKKVIRELEGMPL